MVECFNFNFGDYIMSRHQRILVSYPLEGSNDWSTLHWCDIESDKIGQLHVRVAEATAGGVMPEDDLFMELSENARKKLRVIDYTDGLNPIYCLAINANGKLYRFDFQKRHDILMQNGREWIIDEQADPQYSFENSLPGKRFFPGNRDQRFRMHGGEDYKPLSGFDKNLYQQQVQLWADEQEQLRQAALQINSSVNVPAPDNNDHVNNADSLYSHCFRYDLCVTNNECLYYILAFKDTEKLSDLLDNHHNLLSDFANAPFVALHKVTLDPVQELKEWLFAQILRHQRLATFEDAKAFFELLPEKEDISTAFKAIPNDNLRQFIGKEAQSLSSFCKKYIQYDLIQILFDKFPHDNRLWFAALENTIKNINPRHADVIQHADNALQNLKKLFEQKWNVDDPEVGAAIQVIYGLLYSEPGNKRNNCLRKVRKCADMAQGRPSPLWRAVGTAMMALGTIMALVGVIGIFTGMGTIPGIAVAVSGSALFGGGAALFYHNRQKGCSKALQSLANETEKVVGDIILRPHRR
jgi:hypothetical protein